MTPEESMKDQLRQIFETEKQVDDFLAVYRSVKTFTKKTLSDRQEILSSISYYRGEFSYFVRMLGTKIKETEARLYKSEHSRLNSTGVKPTADLLWSQIWDHSSYLEKKKMENIALKWQDILNDTYFVLQKNNDIISKELGI